MLNVVPTIIQSPLQDGWRTGPSNSNPRESQNLDLIQNVFPKTGELNAVGGVPLHHPEVDRTVRVLLFEHHLIQGRERREMLGKRGFGNKEIASHSVTLLLCILPNNSCFFLRDN